MVPRAQRFVFLVLGILFLANVLVWQAVFYFLRPKLLEVDFFNVGQGDAIFIETPAHHQILIDGGPDSKILEKLGKVLPSFDRSLDLVILTHPEKDHLSGLLFVLRDYQVEQIFWTGVEKETQEFEEWLRLLEKEGAKISLAKKGLRVRAGKVSLDILYPFQLMAGQVLENSNDASIVGRLSFGKNSFLFTGDISELVEKQLVIQENSCISENSSLSPPRSFQSDKGRGECKFANLDSDVLKVGHHGSKYSSSEPFLEAVSPKIAVIQVGKNSYGHPTKEVLQGLEDLGIKTLRTDREGDIKILSEGENLIIGF